MIKINKQNFYVNEDEFVKVPHNEFNNLNILDSLGIQERIVSLLKEISYLGNFKLKCINTTHGGYIPIKLLDFYKKVNVVTNKEQQSNIEKNDTSKSIIYDFTDKNYDVIYINDILLNLEDTDTPTFLLCNTEMNFKRDNYISYKLSDSNLSLHIISEYYEKFMKEFHYYINDDVLFYDNLLHLTMIVKDAGDSFEEVLKHNFPFFDRWTILDTGSTDNTIDIINRVLVGKKKGQLYQEPFINFRDSRNRCLDLAGTDCKFIIMLDDTYKIQDDLRNFLITIRGDQFSDSFSLYIKSNDSEYGSNRIIKSESGLRYIYKLHEVITPKNNINVIIPMNHAFIFDYRSDYMEKRTMDRKRYDLKILHEMVEDEPEDSRALYYLGQTYNLLERYESALEFFLKRVEHTDEGFIQEKIDACFEAARVCNFKLNYPWEECEKLYKKAYEMDPSRPDSLYFIGIHYYLEKQYHIAYEYMKKAFEIGYPIHCQYSLKPTLSYYYLPKFLAELSFMFENEILGKECCDLFLSRNPEDESIDYYTMKCWNKIYIKLMDKPKTPILENKINSKLYFVFLADGGFEPWTGKDIETKGVGGSETFIIEMARYIQKQDYFNVVVFCNCIDNDIYENVHYRKINEYKSFINNNNVDTVMVSRYPEYLPVTYKGNVKNVYLILHDLIPQGEVIIRNEKLRKILCLSEWHCEQFKNMFEILRDLVIPFGYGIDFNLFSKKVEKQKHKFIYSSFPHRGLLPLLEMWPSIYSKYPDAMLHIHCDLDGKWVNSVRPDEMNKIKELIKTHPDGIYYEGWTSKSKLAENWLTSEIWFYPCTFLETFCLTALEAALTNTLVITSDLGSLQNTVADRGIVIQGNAYSKEWQEKALQELFSVIDDPIKKNFYLKKNNAWAKNLSWENRAKELMKIMNIFVSEPKENIKPTIDNIVEYYNFKSNNKKYSALEIGDNKLVLENSARINENNGDIFDELKKVEKTYDIITCSKMKLNDFDYYMLLSRCAKLIQNGGIFLFDSSDCTNEFIKNKNNYTILEKTDVLVCMEKH
jgi:tetratricopeptide (TPR) repeat protein